MITWLILIPLLGATALYAARPFNARVIALGFNAFTLVIAFLLWRNFDSQAGGLQFVDKGVVIHRLSHIHTRGDKL